MHAFKNALRVITVMLFALTPCFLTTEAPPLPLPVQVAVNESGRLATAKGNEDMTVKELLTKAGIFLKDHDKVEPPSDTVWKTAEAESITVRRYAKVTVTDGETSKTLELYDGNVADALKESGFDLDKYTLEGDASAPLTDGMVIRLKKIIAGFVESKGKTYYYIDNERVTDSVVGNENDGYFYAGSDGSIDKGYCGAVETEDAEWNVINGKATPVETESDKTLHYALRDIEKCTNSGMTKQEKLRCAFKYLQDSYLEGVLKTYRGDDWDTFYANGLFTKGKGDCYSFGAAFAYMAKGIGFEECYACNSGGHGWAEVDGLFYDPEWSMHSKKYSYYAMSYDEPCDIEYKESLDRYNSWNHRRV